MIEDPAEVQRKRIEHVELISRKVKLTDQEKALLLMMNRVQRRHWFKKNKSRGKK